MSTNFFCSVLTALFLVTSFANAKDPSDYTDSELLSAGWTQQQIDELRGTDSDEEPSGRRKDGIHEACLVYEELARTVMESRQVGVSLARNLEIVKGNSTMEGIVIAAYNRNQYSSSDYQRKAVNKFADDVLLQCIKSSR